MSVILANGDKLPKMNSTVLLLTLSLAAYIMYQFNKTSTHASDNGSNPVSANGFYIFTFVTSGVFSLFGVSGQTIQSSVMSINGVTGVTLSDNAFAGMSSSFTVSFTWSGGDITIAELGKQMQDKINSNESVIEAKTTFTGGYKK